MVNWRGWASLQVAQFEFFWRRATEIYACEFVRSKSLLNRPELSFLRLYLSALPAGRKRAKPETIAHYLN
jgi:hypothetical protein